MKKPAWLLVVLIVLILSIMFVVWNRDNSTPSTNEENLEHTVDLQNEMVDQLDEVESTNLDQNLTEPDVENSENEEMSELSKTPLLIPNLDDIREQAKNNPHTMAPKLNEFGVHIHERTEFALKSEANASIVMDEFISCAKNVKETLPSMRALCLHQAREISQKFSTFKLKVENLEESIDHATKNIDVLQREN